MYRRVVSANYSPAATLALTNGTGLGNSFVNVGATGTLDLTNPGANVPIQSLAGSGAVTTGASNFNLVVLGGSTTFGGGISGTGGVEIAGVTQTFSGLNTYTNATGIDAGATLALAGNGSIADSLYVAPRGTLDISQTTASATIKGIFDESVNGRVILGSQTLTIAEVAGGGITGPAESNGADMARLARECFSAHHGGVRVEALGRLAGRDAVVGGHEGQRHVISDLTHFRSYPE